MKSKTIIVLSVILIIVLAVSLFFLVRSNYRKGNLALYQQVIEKMKQGGKTHTILPDLGHLQARPFLQSQLHSQSYALAAYINFRRSDYYQADRSFSKIKFTGKLFDIRDYIYYWWGKSLWHLYRQTGKTTYLERAKSNFSKVVNSQLSPLKKKAMFDYIQSCYYSNDHSFYDAVPDTLLHEIAQQRKGDLPEFLYIMAEANQKQGNIAKSTAYLVRLWKEYPYSDWGKKAGELMENMGKSSLIEYPQLSAGELLDIYDLQYQRNRTKASMMYIKDHLKKLEEKVSNRQIQYKINLLYGKIYYILGPWSRANYYLSRAFRSIYPEIKVEAAYYLMRRAKNLYYFNTLKNIVRAINSTRYMQSEYFEKTVYLSGFSFMRRKRYKDAIPIYKVVLRKKREDNYYYDFALWRLQWCYYHLKQYRQAVEILKKLRENSNWEEYALYWTAYIYQKNNQIDEARTLYRQLLTDYGYTYYGILADQTLRKDFQEKVGFEKNLKKFVPYKVGLIEHEKRNNRYQILKDNGLYEFAAIELEEYLREKNISRENDEEYWKPYGAELSKLYFYSSQYIKTGLYIYWVYKEFVLKGGKNIPQWFWDMYYPVFYKELIDRYVQVYGGNRDFLYAFIRQESYYEPFAVSPAGAIGVMQIMPDTGRQIFKQVGADLGLKDYYVQLLYQPEVNIPMGIYHLKFNLYDRLKKYISEKGLYNADKESIITPLMIAGYNAGLSRAYRWVKETPFDNQQELIDQVDIPETRRYVKLVLKHLFLYKKYQKSK